jgi:thiopeptide-type bacteriocin biosynthesis protein
VEGVAVAESVFCHDSWAVAELLYLAKSIPLKLDRNMMVLLSLDALLEGLGLDSVSRFEWCRSQCSSRKEGSRDFQSRKAALRGLLGSPTRLQEEPGGKELARVLTIFKERLRAPSIDLHALDVGQKLDRPLDSLNASFVHMHLNRFGFSGPAEKNIVGLLWRIRQSLFHTPEL